MEQTIVCERHRGSRSLVKAIKIEHPERGVFGCQPSKFVVEVYLKGDNNMAMPSRTWLVTSSRFEGDRLVIGARNEESEAVTILGWFENARQNNVAIVDINTDKEEVSLRMPPRPPYDRDLTGDEYDSAVLWDTVEKLVQSSEPFRVWAGAAGEIRMWQDTKS